MSLTLSVSQVINNLTLSVQMNGVVVTVNPQIGMFSASGGGAVNSVNGKVGTVVLDVEDIADTTTRRYTNDTDIARLANTSGTNTGDQVIPTSTSDISDTTTRRYTNDTDIARLANTSGTNTGDQVIPTSTSDISDTTTRRYTNDTDIARLANTSGTNTGDQVIPTSTSGFTNNGADGVNPFVTQSEINLVKIIQVTGVEVLAASFSLVSGLYEASISNVNILATSSVDVVPASSTIEIVKTAEFMPETDASAGAVKVFCKNLPTGNFFVTLLIQPTNG